LPWTNNATIESLRLRYNVALTAYHASKRALIAAASGGGTPSPELVETEKACRATMDDVRAKLLAAMTVAITGGVEPKPPPRI
jgi:hypothetical protein